MSETVGTPDPENTAEDKGQLDRAAAGPALDWDDDAMDSPGDGADVGVGADNDRVSTEEEDPLHSIYGPPPSDLPEGRA